MENISKGCVCVCVCVCVHIYLNHFALQQKQIQHCKSTILQLKKDCKKSKIAFLTVCHLLRLKAVRVYRLSILLTIIPPVQDLKHHRCKKIILVGREEQN